MSEKEMEKAKNIRRAAKSTFTRTVNAVYTLISAKRPSAEVLKGFQDAKTTHHDLASKHEEYTMYLNDEDYEMAEEWMADCTDKYTRFAIEVNNYIECLKKETEKENAASVDCDVSETTNEDLQGSKKTNEAQEITTLENKKKMARKPNRLY